MPPGDGARPRNLGISQRLAVLIAGSGATMAAVTIVVTVLIYGLNERTTPVVLPLVGALGTILISLTSALKSAEAADTAAETHKAAEYSISQNAALMHSVRAHCGEICPALNCPMRRANGEGS